MALERDLAASLTLAVGVLFAAGPDLYADGTTSTADSVEAAARDSAPVKTDVVRERYASQAVKVERSITQDANLNFVNHGPWTMWDPAGNLIAQGEYRFGKRHGAWKRAFFASPAAKAGDPAKGDEFSDAF